MPLMRGKLFAGALFAGLLFGQQAQEASLQQQQYGGGDEEDLRRYTELLTSALRGRQQANESERIEALALSSDGLQRDGETTASFGNLGVARQDTLIVSESKIPIIERVELSDELIANETSYQQRLALLLIAMEV